VKRKVTFPIKSRAIHKVQQNQDARVHTQGGNAFLYHACLAKEKEHRQRSKDGKEGQITEKNQSKSIINQATDSSHVNAIFRRQNLLAGEQCWVLHVE
jgi:hypothetical protein